MYLGTDFDPADPGESEPFAFDITADVAPGETIASAAWSCAVSLGTDSGAAGRLSGSPVNTGSVTSQGFSGLLGGVTYLVQALVTTSAGRVLSYWSHITCETPD